MAAKKKSWAAIETVYIRGNKSYRELAKKYSVSERALSRYASEHQWVLKRQRFRDKVAAETENKLVQKESDKLIKLGEAADKMSEVIKNCLSDEKQFQRRVVSHMDGTVDEIEVNTYNTNAIKQLTGALKDLAVVLRDCYSIPRQEKPQEKIEVSLVMPKGSENFDC